MDQGPGTSAPLTRELLPAREGVGPLLQRDYWAAISRARLAPSALMHAVAARFPELAPPEIVTFRRAPDAPDALAVGEELDVSIRVAGACRVRVLHRDAQSLTLGTLAGHPEAGRITFGAYRNDYRDVVFHIRSRARSSTQLRYAGFLAGGESLQTLTWTDFVAAVAFTFGDGVIGAIHADTRRIPDEPDDPRVACGPTFRAEGD